MALLAQTKALLREFGLRAHKGLGQHFLIDRRVLNRSISASEPGTDEIVVEVGAGLGMLTERLAEKVKTVLAIETDPQLASILTERLGYLSNVVIINADILQIDIAQLLGEEHNDVNYKVVANLPYFIATPTIQRFLEAPIKPQCMVVMVQKEVAQSIVASSGKMGIASISVQLYGKPTIISYVKAHSFYPPPEVDSAILRIDVYEHPAIEVQTEDFFHVLKSGFSAPRKQLRNSLAQGLSVPQVAAAEFLNKAAISPQRRAETLSLEEWANLYRIIYEQ